MSKQITKFSQIARIINRGNSIVVDKKGIEGNVDKNVLAGWYLKQGGDQKQSDGGEEQVDSYQRRITAPWLVDPLLDIAGDLRMQISILKPQKPNRPHWLVCVVSRTHYSSQYPLGKLFHGTGYCQLEYSGITHNQEDAMLQITIAAKEAKASLATAISIMHGQYYPVAVEMPTDDLLSCIG